MADVSDGGGRRDRGQLILVGGLVVAFALVALVLLLNTSLFAQNLSTRGIDPAVDRAQDHRDFARQGGRAVLEAENARGAAHTDWTDVEANLTRDLTAVATVRANDTFRRAGGSADLSINRTREGAVVLQNASRNFTSADGNATWTLATTMGVRAFGMTLEDVQAADDPFRLTVAERDGTDEWSATVNATGPTTVVVETANGTSCTVSGLPVTIDWTAGSVSGCSVPFGVDGSGGDLSGPLEVSYENADLVEGSYRLVVSQATGDESIAAGVEDRSDPAGPWTHPAAYSVVLDVTYREGETRYATTVRVAPDEPPETNPT